MRRQLIWAGATALLFFAPSVSFAAPLTQAQAESLIGVVQASPGTPASAFTSLITAFSNITTVQAESLISVVQASPGTLAGSFVGLITSFTQDVPVTTQNTSSTSSTCTTPSGAVMDCQTGQIVSGPSQQWQNQISSEKVAQPNVHQPTPEPTYTAPPTVQTNQPQEIEQVGMNKFLVDVSNGVNTVTSNYNQNCYNNGQGSANQACLGLSGVENSTLQLENYATSVQDSYRSSSCDQQLSGVLEQILQADLSESKSLTGMLHGFQGLQGDFLSQVANIINGANALTSPLATKAQMVVSTCK